MRALGTQVSRLLILFEQSKKFCKASKQCGYFGKVLISFKSAELFALSEYTLLSIKHSYYAVMYIVILEETIDDCSSVFLIANIIPSLVLDACNKTILE